MKFSVGMRVKFLTMPEEGVITKVLGNGMVNVYVAKDDWEIPAFEEDLVKAENFSLHLPIVDIPLEAMPMLKNETKIISFRFPLTQKGVFILFDTQGTKYDIWLINDTTSPLVIDAELSFQDGTEWQRNEKIPASEAYPLGEMQSDDLNESPQIQVTITPVFTSGLGERLEKTLKIKPQQFFKALAHSTYLNRPTNTFLLFEKLEENKEEEGSLQKYTKNLIKTPTKKADEPIKETHNTVLTSVMEYAFFDIELDLHIELLHDHHRDLTPTEIINVQLKEFDIYLSKALHLGIPKVYIIHGIGKGRLKEAISARLRRHDKVKFFKNEYHEKYGMGATEVFLAKPDVR